MRLLQSILPYLKQTKKPQCKFVTHLLGLMLMLPGHATFRNLSRYSPSHERTFARWYGRDFDWVSLNKAAITEVVPPEHDQALVMDASFVPKSGKHTSGLDRLWNGSHSRAEKGLEISTLAWLDITDTCAYSLSVEQTPPRAEPLSLRPPGWLSLATNSAGGARRMTCASCVTWSPMGRTAHSNLLPACGAWGYTSLANGAPMPICALATRGPSTQGQAAKTPTTARSTGATYRALNDSRPKTSTSCCPIRFSTMCNCNVISRWWSSSIPNATDMPCSSAQMQT